MPSNDRCLPVAEPDLSNLERERALEAIDSGWISSLGKFIGLFEQSFAKYCGTKFGVAVSNGTTGLHLALVAYGIGPGDEVIVPDLTFVATANAVCHAGAKPVFADIDADTLCLSAKSVEKQITSKTKAIIPVHLFGHPADMDAINALAKKHNLIVIEDSAEAIGAEYQGQRVGSLGHVGVFSFYGNKVITTGEGGMITTNDAAIHSRLLFLRDHAMSTKKKYWHEEIGYNYRLTNLQAAIGVSQLERIDSIFGKRQNIFSWYNETLPFSATFKPPHVSPWAKLSPWMYYVRCEGFTEKSREVTMAELKKAGIDSRPFFYPISDMPMYKTADTPAAHRISTQGLMLPSSTKLQKSDVLRVCDELTRVLHEQGILRSHSQKAA